MPRYFITEVAILLLLPALYQSHDNVYSPIIIVPGYMGSKLHAEINNKSYPPPMKCSSHESYHLLWAELWRIDDRCEIYDLRPVYNTTTHQFVSGQGVNITVEPRLRTTDCLIADSWTEVCTLLTRDASAGYMHRLILALTHSLEYVADVTLLASPFDWRFDPQSSELSTYHTDLKVTVEQAYARNRRRVVFVGHSYGNLLLSTFLEAMDEEWREKHVQEVVMTAPPLGGSPDAALMLATGKPFAITWGNWTIATLIDADESRTFARNSPAVPLFLPAAVAFGSDYEFATVNGTGFTIERMDKFLATIGAPNAFDIYKKYHIDHEISQRPVTTCVFGTGVDTAYRLDYGVGGWDSPTIINGSGDGTVTEYSADLCRRWSHEEGASVNVVTIDGAKHVSILEDGQFLALLHRILTRDQPSSRHRVFHTVVRTSDVWRCYSAWPVYKCEEGYVAAEVVARNTSFVCTGWELEEQLTEQVEQGVPIYLLDAPSTLFAMVEVPTQCVLKSPGWVDTALFFNNPTLSWN